MAWSSVRFGTAKGAPGLIHDPSILAALRVDPHFEEAGVVFDAPQEHVQMALLASKAEHFFSLDPTNSPQSLPRGYGFQTT